MNRSNSFTPTDFPGIMDLYGLNSYPLGINCMQMSENLSVVSDYRQYLSNASSGSPFFLSEFQGGAYDSWGGEGYESCSRKTSMQFVNVFYKNNIAQKITMISQNMAAGGTNWGAIGSPDVYSSYDFGAAISENRVLRDKAFEQKLLWTFVRSSPTLATANFVGDSNQVPYSDNPDVFVTELRDQKTDAGYYIVRHRDTNSDQGQVFRLLIRSDTEGVRSIPGKSYLSLMPRESKIIVTDYPVGSKFKLGFSTLEVFMWTYFDRKPLVVLYGNLDEVNEISIKNAGNVDYKFYCIRDTEPFDRVDFKPMVTKTNDLRLSFTLSGQQRAIVNSTEYTILLISHPEIHRAWAPSLGSHVDPSVPVSNQILVLGPHLVRNISEVSGSGLAINGDMDLKSSDDAYVEIFAEEDYKKFFWNGQEILHFRRTDYGSFLFEVTMLSTNLAKVAIQPLDRVDWIFIDSLPERLQAFDDSKWIIADKQESNNRFFPPLTLPVLYPAEYGFYSGVVLYRGRFVGSAKGLSLDIWGGKAFAFAIWVNGEYIGSYSGESHVDHVERELEFPEGLLHDGLENLLLIVADQMGYDSRSDATEDGEAERHAIHHPRGIRMIELTPFSIDDPKPVFSSWRLQGNVGGDKYDDLLRAPYNEGGLYGQRIGGHLPGNIFDDWQAGSPFIGQLPGVTRQISPPSGVAVRLYRANVDVQIPAVMDVPLGIHMKGTGVRAELFVNGWQFGKYVSDIGPQDEFPIPPGILNTRGSNVIAIQVWSMNDSVAAGLHEIEWVKYGRYVSGYGAVPHEDYHGWYVDRSAQLAKYKF